MRVTRSRQPEHPLKRDLLRRRAEQIDAANDGIHALSSIINHDRKLIRERSVGAADEKVAAIARKVLLVSPLDRILYRNGLIGNAKPHGRSLFGRPSRNLIGR